MNTNVTSQLHINNMHEEKLSAARAALTIVSRKSYFVEDARIVIDRVLATYIDRELLETGNTSATDWNDAEIPVNSLEQFIATHYQLSMPYSDINVAIYLEENLKDIAEAYLNSGKEFIVS